MEWLPDIVCCDHRNWVEIVEGIYPIFKRDFIDSRPMLDGMEVRLREAPLLDGKDRTFWHFVTQGFDDRNRIPDLLRCERIAWVRSVIDHANDPRLRRWEQERQGSTNVAIALPDFEYIVFLGRRQPLNGAPYFLALTAYNVDSPRKREKHRKEWQAYGR